MKSRLVRVSDGIVVGANTLSILMLLWLVLADLIRSNEGTYMTWIQIEGHGGDWTTVFGIEILPLMALATIFLVTQIYLNLRLIQGNSTAKEDSIDQDKTLPQTQTR